MEWFFRHTNKSSSLEPNVWSPLACERAQRKKVRVRAYGEVFSVHTRRVHCSCHCLDAKLPERTKTEKCARLRMEAAFKWIWQWLRPCRSDFPYKSPHTSRVWRSWRCRCYRWSHHSLSCHPWECRACHWWSQDEELHHIGLSVHFEDEDDEKYVGQLKLNRFKCCWTAGSNVLFCLVRNFIGMWGTPLPWARWKLARTLDDDLQSGR